MRYVLGFFPPDRLFAIVDALSESHAHGLTISPAILIRADEVID